MARLIFFLLSPFLIYGNHFESRLEKAATGDFIVMEQNKILSLISLQKKTPHSIWIEQITVPKSFQKKIPNWKSWVHKKAPGHTSWIRYEIDLKTKKITECFSYSQSAWLQLRENQSILSKLLCLNLEKLPSTLRKKVGPPPISGEVDTRPLWKPFMIFQGEIQPVSADAFIAQWPKDGTELSGKYLELFFDHEGIIAFPYWILIHTKNQTFTVHIQDCGKDLQSPFSELPRRSPVFSDKMYYDKQKLVLEAQSPIYYQDFYLYARDLNDAFQKPKLLPFSLKREDEKIWIEIHKKALSKLQKNHFYTWLLIPKEFPTVHAETKNSFQYK